ncbi:predicted protein [Streptomyces viridochromogenes DSM 40736]|uniref:Predicted protein n=1 Tax=Streptomyces viridochromogenes (strain DSM 40736 / JCM 4977 / BCRC 1201 / Tue 494) TaxID=591159 RepID=D9XCC3_STRVT|nr:hypothetical protein [Streptomyces viridochromogenes]EFL32380.1 predicted protein [Streptomyces viridochromogenes DSM 40736]
MGSLRVTVCTSALAVAALTPAAYAADTGGVSVIPAFPAPGSDVTLRVTHCAERTAVAASAAFVADARLVAVTEGEVAGESRVRSTVVPGTYTVRVTCGGAERTGTFTVRRRAGQQPHASGAESGAAPGTASGSAGQPPAPGAVGQPPAPGTAGRLPAPGSAGQPPAPGPAGQLLTPPAAGQPPAPPGGTAGQPPAPGTAGRPPAPGTAGQPPLPEGGGQPSAPGYDGQSSVSRRPGAHASPVAPVAAGGGGAADLVAAADHGTGPDTARGVSPGTAQGMTGLLLAGVAALVIALGGLRRGRGTG